MFTISKRFDFSASHRLEGLPEDHPCSRLHGHNYSVEVELHGQLDKVGFVFDYRRLDPVKKWIDDTFDHQHLNSVMDPNPTAEHLALRIFNMIGSLVDLPDAVELAAVRVHETPKTCAEYRP